MPCARAESFQKFGASTSRSSAASLALARSGSKMPPEQGQGLLDVVDHGFGLSAHLFLASRISGTSRQDRNVPAASLRIVSL
jgi:hypothetical protein